MNMPRSIPALILAAGRGSRMAEATQDRPKCLTELMGRPILLWQKEALERAGLSPVSAIGGYRADDLRKYIAVNYVNERWAETQMVATLFEADDLLSKQTVIVSYGDIVCRSSTIETLSRAPGDITITYDRLWLKLWEHRFADPLSDAETFRLKKGLLQEIGGRAKTTDEIEGQYMGLLKFTPYGWQQVKEHLLSLPEKARDRLDMTSLLSQLLQKSIAVQGVGVDGGWIEIDTQSDAAFAEKAISEERNSGNIWPHDWRE